MTSAEFDKGVGELNAEAAAIVKAKRPGYTAGNADVLKNFKSAAEAAKITTAQAWAVLFKKGIDSILTLMTQPDLPQAESAIGRFADAKNYLDLGWAIYCEPRLEKAKEVVAREEQLKLPFEAYESTCTYQQFANRTPQIRESEAFQKALQQFVKPQQGALQVVDKRS